MTNQQIVKSTTLKSKAQKKVIEALQQAAIEDTILSLLLSKKTVKYSDIEEYFNTAEFQVDDLEIFLEYNREFSKEEPEEITKIPASDVCGKYLPEIGFTNITSAQLKTILGEPEESDSPSEDGFRYMYTLKIGKSIYEIYDKADTNGTFDDNFDLIEWYSSSNGTMKTLRTAFNIQIPYCELSNLGEINTTSEFLDKLSTRVTNPDQDSEWRFGYYITIGKKTFFIHDLADEDDGFDNLDDIEWFVRGNGALKTLQKELS